MQRIKKSNVGIVFPLCYHPEEKPTNLQEKLTTRDKNFMR